jgi:hypothetical protein
MLPDVAIIMRRLVMDWSRCLESSYTLPPHPNRFSKIAPKIRNATVASLFRACIAQPIKSTRVCAGGLLFFHRKAVFPRQLRSSKRVSCSLRIAITDRVFSRSCGVGAAVASFTRADNNRACRSNSVMRVTEFHRIVPTTPRNKHRLGPRQQQHQIARAQLDALIR